MDFVGQVEETRMWEEGCEKENGFVTVGQLKLETNLTEVEKLGNKGNEAKKTCYRQRKWSAEFSGFKEERDVYGRYGE